MLTFFTKTAVLHFKKIMMMFSYGVRDKEASKLL